LAEEVKKRLKLGEHIPDDEVRVYEIVTFHHKSLKSGMPAAKKLLGRSLGTGAAKDRGQYVLHPNENSSFMYVDALSSSRSKHQLVDPLPHPPSKRQRLASSPFISTPDHLSCSSEAEEDTFFDAVSSEAELSTLVSQPPSRDHPKTSSRRHSYALGQRKVFSSTVSARAKPWIQKTPKSVVLPPAVSFPVDGLGQQCQRTPKSKSIHSDFVFSSPGFSGFGVTGFSRPSPCAPAIPPRSRTTDRGQIEDKVSGIRRNRVQSLGGNDHVPKKQTKLPFDAPMSHLTPSRRTFGTDRISTTTPTATAILRCLDTNV
jgi:hypothetical protein